MIIRFYRNSYLPQYLSLAVLAAILRLPGFYIPLPEPVVYDAGITPGYSLLQNLLGNNRIGEFITGTILVLAAGLLLNFTLEKYTLVPRNTLLPSFLFVLFMTYSPVLEGLYPQLIATSILICVLYFILGIYNVEESYSEIFNSGLLIAIASMFYFPSLIFVLFILATFMVFRLYQWREWVIIFLGLITPYLFLFLYYFWFDKLEQAFQAYGDYFAYFLPHKIIGSIAFWDIVILIILILLFLKSVGRIISGYNEKILVIRKMIGSLGWLFFFGLFTSIFSGMYLITHQAFLLTALTVFIAIHLTSIKKSVWMDIFLGILAILIIINNYSGLLF